MRTTDYFMKMKENNEKISMITAYDYPSAKMVESVETDMILVGDSLGMVVLGYESTIEVTLADMIHHAKSVKRGAPNTFIVVDMPFMTYNISIEDSLKNAKDLFQSTNVHALKLEGASVETLELTRKLTDSGIPVVIHLGLQPQSVNIYGGYKVQGKTEQAAQKILEDAIKSAESGAIALVLECIPKELAAKISNEVIIPTIGIGSGVDCDGQVLVYHDLLRYGIERSPKFVKSYTDFDALGSKALKTFIDEVKTTEFPLDKHSFTPKK